MDLKSLALALKIENYPEKFEEIYAYTDLDSTDFCSIEAVEKFEAEYSAFGDQLPIAIKGAEDIINKPCLIAWGNIASEYLKSCTAEEAYAIPFPDDDLSPAGRTLRLFVLMSAVPRCIRSFKAHGFTEDEIFPTLKCFGTSIELVGLITGVYGIDKRYYNWILHYILCEMFDCGSLVFQFMKMPSPIVLLKNKQDQRHVILMTEGSFHKSGQVLGTPGYTDKEGSYDADFSETDDAFIGRCAVEGNLLNEISKYKKSEWECVLRKDSLVVSVHIPRKTDLSRDVIKKSFSDAVKIINERFSEYDARYFFCLSWMLDFRYKDILGEDSKLVQFGNMFSRFPMKCTGRDGYGCLFLGYTGPDEDLPESTSLQRKIKALYLSGGYTYSSVGIITDYPIN